MSFSKLNDFGRDSVSEGRVKSLVVIYKSCMRMPSSGSEVSFKAFSGFPW